MTPQIESALCQGCRALMRIELLLERIAAALEREALMDTAPATPTACQHPESARVVFAGMGSKEEWECAVFRGGCGYRHSG